MHRGGSEKKVADAGHHAAPTGRLSPAGASTELTIIQHAIKCPTFFSSRVAAVYLDSVDNLRLGDARPPLVRQVLFEGSAVLVRIARLQFS